MAELLIPNLGGVITKADISTKGTGSYAADYINWARTTQLLRDNAPGWQFSLIPDNTGSFVWKAPDNTGFVLGHFAGPDGSETPLFPQAVMDNRNNPITYDKVSARDLTDSHRRCLCTAAAFSFGLGYELWAKEVVEDPHRPEPVVAPVAAAPKQEQPKVVSAKEEPAPLRMESPTAYLKTTEVKALKVMVTALPAEQRNALVAAFRAKFNIKEGVAISDYIRDVQHRDFINTYLQQQSAGVQG